MSLASRLLEEFVARMDRVLRITIEMSLRLKLGTSLSEVISRRAGEFFRVLAESLGEHNARLVAYAFVNWLKQHNPRLDREEVFNAIISGGDWAKLLEQYYDSFGGWSRIQASYNSGRFPHLGEQLL